MVEVYNKCGDGNLGSTRVDIVAQGGMEGENTLMMCVILRE